MQVFIIGSPLSTARALDKRRLNKQIIECEQILSALNGAKAWSNHPCVLQYRGHEEWLNAYLMCLKCFQIDSYFSSMFNYIAMTKQPAFHTKEYFSQMKRRLYQKDNEHYKQWRDLGESLENWYFVDGEWRKYVNGKRIN